MYICIIFTTNKLTQKQTKPQGTFTTTYIAITYNK